jgi:hypothetical protein
MSAQSEVLRIRMQRLLDERGTVTNLHDDLLAHVESRDESERSLTEIEQGQIDGYRARSAELDTEIEALSEHMKREDASVSASKEIRAHLAGRMEGVRTDGDGLVYETFAAYARDFVLARSQGNIAEQIVAQAGGEDARRAAKERLARSAMGRAPANTLKADVAGLIPEQHIAQIFQVIETRRPLVASASRATLERGTLTYPKVTQRPVVAVQTTEKTEAGNQKMIVGMLSAQASTYLGGGDLSWQAVEWSTPNALDLWFRLAAADYALKTEQDAGEVLQTAGFENNVSSPLGATPTYAQFLTAVAAGIGEVYANSGDMADTLYLAPDRAAMLLGLTSDVLGVFAGGTLSFADSSGNIAGLSVVISRGLDSGVMVVGVRSKLLIAETGGAPVQLRVVEPAIGGFEVGLIGAFEAVAVEDEAFSLLTTAS